MNEIENFNGAEYSVPVRAEGKILLGRLLLLLLYVTFAGAYCYVCLGLTKMAALIAILPLFLLILVLATWRFVNFEWGVRVQTGKLIVMKVRGKKESKVATYDLSTVSAAAPIRFGEVPSAFGVKEVINYRPYKKAQAYALTVNSEKGKTVQILIPVSRQLIKSIRHYNVSVPLDDDYLRI